MLYSLLVVVWIPFSQTTIGSNVNSDTLLDIFKTSYTFGYKFWRSPKLKGTRARLMKR